MNADLIAVLDVGKTNTKLLVVDADSGAVAWHAERASQSIVSNGLRQLDVGGIESWLLASLTQVPEKERIRAIVPVAHGAAAVLIDAAGRVLAAPDYEDAQFDAVAEAYRELRDPFEATFSPFLPLGLNLGRQLFYFQTERRNVLADCTSILLHPQYWAWRLSGVLASEVTSLGCHSDLWRPVDNQFSRLANRAGWAAKLPPMRAASDSLGCVSPEVMRLTGLDPACRVLCGIHDSNASYYWHMIDRPRDQPFAVISSGTWTIVMAHGTDLVRLQPDRDMLANVDALGSPIGTARFMGGREFEAIAGRSAAAGKLELKTLAEILTRKAMALPSFVDAGGPFGGTPGRIVNATGLDADERAMLATLYCALVTDLLLEWLDARGEIVIDGPLAANSMFASILAALVPGRSVLSSPRAAGSVCGALKLAGRGQRIAPPPSTASALEGMDLAAYRSDWRTRALQKH